MRSSFQPDFHRLLTVCLAVSACGGGQAASGDFKVPDTTAGSAAPSAAPAATGSAADSPASTTTAVTLGDAGELQGAKLSETHTVAATSGSTAPAAKGPHAHDPGRSPADIRAIIMAHRDEARACYDKALAAHPGIEGDLVVQWTIDPKGNVTQVSTDPARSQITEPGVAGCIGDVIRKIQFASSAGGFETKAFYPFNFHPRTTPQPGSRTP